MSPTPRRRFHPHYREQAALEDGTPVVLRLLTPADAPLLREGFRQLSPRSRLLRFHQPKPVLSEREVRYLTAVDGEQHFALGAVLRGADGGERGLGAARFLRLAGEPDTAEAAVTVIDAFQTRGLGRLLLARLAAAARERGVRHFACWVLAGNASMRTLLERLGATGAEVDGELLRYTLPLPPATSPPGASLWRLLARAAAGAGVLLGRERSPEARLAPPERTSLPWFP